MPETLVQARELAAAFLNGMRRQDLALVVLAGSGDDFPEVVTAIAALETQLAQTDHRDQALKHYADIGFWDDELPGGSLASHDRGEIARNVLAGRPPFYHRD